VLDPGEIRVPGGRCSEPPPHVIPELLPAPLLHVERGIGENEIRFQVRVKVAAEAVGMLRPQVPLDTPDGEVHLREPPGGGVRLLTVDANIPDLPAVGLHELLALDKHPARAAAGVKDPAMVGREHLDEDTDHAPGRVELAALLPLRARELGEEVLVHPAENVLRPVLLIAEADGPDEVDELAKALLVEGRAGVVLREDAPEGGVVLLNGDHGFVQGLPNGRLLRAGLEVEPACHFRDPEDVLHPVLVGVFEGLGSHPGILDVPLARRITILGFECSAALPKSIGDVLQEDEAEHHVLVLGGIHVVPELVGRLPEGSLEAEIGPVGGSRCRPILRSFTPWHNLWSNHSG